VDEGGYSLERLPGGRIRFRYTWGGPIPDSPRPPPGSLENLLECNRRLAIDGCTYSSGAGDRMDLELTVSGLLNARGAARF
jgi:hypothetical protein